jgi:hypoxanthine phosphoribosyltransferase
MKEIILEDKKFKSYISHKQIEVELKRIASEICRDMSDKKPLFICLLNGSFIFAADLLKRLDFSCAISFVKLKSYIGIQSSGTVQEIIGLNEPIEGRTIVVVDDIIDTGTTIFYLIKQLKEMKPADIKVATMFFKPDACQYSLKIDYLGMMIVNKFVVGYGLDYNGLGRNNKDLYILSET